MKEPDQSESGKKHLITRGQFIRGAGALTLVGAGAAVLDYFNVGFGQESDKNSGEIIDLDHPAEFPGFTINYPEARTTNIAAAAITASSPLTDSLEIFTGELNLKERSSEISDSDIDDLLKNIGFNGTEGVYLINGDLSGNYLMKYAFGTEVKIEDLGNEDNVRNLVKLKKVFQRKVEETQNHVGIKFKKGEAIYFSDTQGIRDSYNVQDDTPIEINKICYFDGKIYLGVTNSFTGTGHSQGDLFVIMPVEEAIRRMNSADKRSTIVEHVAYRESKNINIAAAFRHLSKSPRLSGVVDIIRAVGMVGPTQQLIDIGYVPGQAWDARNKRPIENIISGGVCHGVTTIFSSLILGADAFGIPYKVLRQDPHSDKSNRYVLITNHPRAREGRTPFDVTAYASSTEVLAGGTIELLDNKALTWHCHPIHNEPWILRAVIETRLAK